MYKHFKKWDIWWLGSSIFSEIVLQIPGDCGMSLVGYRKSTGILWEGSSPWRSLLSLFCSTWGLRGWPFLTALIPQLKTSHCPALWPNLDCGYIFVLCFGPNFKYKEMFLKWENDHFLINFRIFLYLYYIFLPVIVPQIIMALKA